MMIIKADAALVGCCCCSLRVVVVWRGHEKTASSFLHDRKKDPVAFQTGGGNQKM